MKAKNGEFEVGFDADNLGQSSLMGPLPQHQSNSLTHRSS